jgi:DNA-binding transcriptional ArsR family regulator
VSTGRYRNYFVKEKVGRNDKKVLSFLQKDMYHKIILSLFISINCTRSRLIEELDLDIHPNTMAYHLKKLVSMDIIEISPVKDGIIIGVENNFPPIVEYSVISNEKLYRLKDPQYIYDLLIIYRDELEEDSLIYFIFELMEYREKFGYSDRGYIRSRPEKVDLMINKLYEVFPHPYHV